MDLPSFGKSMAMIDALAALRCPGDQPQIAARSARSYFSWFFV